MDGSTVALPSTPLPGGLARDDALFRIVYYGEALRAMTEHVSDKLISGACGPMIDMLDDAFDRMSETRDSFGPEEFTLFVMSKMLGLCEDVDEARQFQIGAARYILKSSEALPDAYAAIVDDARQMVDSTDAKALSPDQKPTEDEPTEASGPEPQMGATQDAPVAAAAPAQMAIASPATPVDPAPRPQPSVAPAQRQKVATKPAGTRPNAARPERAARGGVRHAGRPTRVIIGRRRSFGDKLERMFGLLVLFAILTVVFLTAFGNIHPADLIGPDERSDAPSIQ